jgi:hypothetical protein
MNTVRRFGKASVRVLIAMSLSWSFASLAQQDAREESSMTYAEYVRTIDLAKVHQVLRALTFGDEQAEAALFNEIKRRIAPDASLQQDVPDAAYLYSYFLWEGVADLMAEKLQLLVPRDPRAGEFGPPRDLRWIPSAAFEEWDDPEVPKGDVWSRYVNKMRAFDRICAKHGVRFVEFDRGADQYHAVMLPADRFRETIEAAKRVGLVLVPMDELKN